jgi:hypothetical protein
MPQEYDSGTSYADLAAQNPKPQLSPQQLLALHQATGGLGQLLSPGGQGQGPDINQQVAARLAHFSQMQDHANRILRSRQLQKFVAPVGQFIGQFGPQSDKPCTCT